MRIKFIVIITIIILLLIQCKSSDMSQLTRIVNNSYSYKFLNPDAFESGRKHMFKKISQDILESDSIIILELFPDGTGGRYYTAIYNSKNKKIEAYNAVTGNSLHVDSLIYTSNNDKILSMIINGNIEEVIKRGQNSTITPASRIIINIITKDNKGKYNGKVLITNNFGY